MAVKRLVRADFARITSGKTSRLHGRFFTLLILRGALESLETEPKFTCVVSKKTAKRAVDRNRIKRQAREAARTALKEFKKPASLVLYAKKETLRAPYRDIAADIHSLISNI